MIWPSPSTAFQCTVANTECSPNSRASSSTLDQPATPVTRGRQPSPRRSDPVRRCGLANGSPLLVGSQRMARDRGWLRLQRRGPSSGGCTRRERLRSRRSPPRLWQLASERSTHSPSAEHNKTMLVPRGSIRSTRAKGRWSDAAAFSRGDPRSRMASASGLRRAGTPGRHSLKGSLFGPSLAITSMQRAIGSPGEILLV